MDDQKYQKINGLYERDIRSNENVLRESAAYLGINEPLMTLRTDDDLNQYSEEILASYVSWINSVQQWIDEVSMLSKKVEKIKTGDNEK